MELSLYFGGFFWFCHPILSQLHTCSGAKLSILETKVGKKIHVGKKKKKTCSGRNNVSEVVEQNTIHRSVVVVRNKTLGRYLRAVVLFSSVVSNFSRVKPRLTPSPKEKLAIRPCPAPPRLHKLFGTLVRGMQAPCQ